MSSNSTTFSQPTSVGWGASETQPQTAFIRDELNPLLEVPESDPAPLDGPGIPRSTNGDSIIVEGSVGSAGNED
jgi:hypothetical protein